MAVSDKLSCSCGKSTKWNPVLSKGFVNYLQIDSHNHRELMDLKMREHNYSFVSRTHCLKDKGILASTHKPEDTRMWRCEDTNKRKWTWRYEDVRMLVYKQAHTNLRLWGCRDASKGICMNLKIWGYKDAGYKPAYTNIRIWGCEETKITTSTQSTWA